MSKQTFPEWLLDKHWKEPTPLGDLAREFGDVLSDAGGERGVLRKSVEYYVGPESWALDAFDTAWAEYDPPPPPPAHPFVLWLVEHHGEADTPLGVFARDLRESEDFPLRGDRLDLRRFLEHVCNNDTWVLGCFDVAWSKFAPTCTWSGCMEPADGESSVCTLHGLL